VSPLLLIGTLLTVTACSAGPSQRPPVATSGGTRQAAPVVAAPQGTSVPSLGPPANATLRWHDCTTRTVAELGTSASGTKFSCTTAQVPLNNPDAVLPGQAHIALLSVGTGRIPLVVLNGAGGEPGTEFAARLALRLPPPLLSTFRIIGMDQSGTGQSDAPQCVPAPDRQTIVGFDPDATGQDALGRLANAANAAMQGCLGALPDRLQSYNPSQTAADLEQLRILLGVPKLHAVARGNASQALITYAHRYPASAGRMVLDGIPDATLNGIASTDKQAQSAEATFDAFAANCTQNGCPLGSNPRQAVTSLIQRTRATPLAAPGGPVSAGDITEAVLLGLGDQSRWAELTSALAAGIRGDGAPLAAMTAPLVNSAPGAPARLDAQLINGCDSTSFRLPTQLAASTATDWVHDYPLFGGLFAQRLIRCSTWPLPQQAPVTSAPGIPPVMVISTANDPVTPASGTVAMAAQLPSAALTNWQGAGDGALGQSDCVDEAVSQYLIEGTPPVNNMVCPA
jgi:pimeloyl-ACP methyl ester carboxylesterase